MGRALTGSGAVYALIDECADAGVVFRTGADGLRATLTRGRPPDTLLARVKERKAEIARLLKDLTDFDAAAQHPPLPETREVAEKRDAVEEWRKRHGTDSK